MFLEVKEITEKVEVISHLLSQKVEVPSIDFDVACLIVDLNQRWSPMAASMVSVHLQVSDFKIRVSSSEKSIRRCTTKKLNLEFVFWDSSSFD